MFVIILKEQRNDLAATAGRFFCCFFLFLCCKYNEKIKKIKKNQKKIKKNQKKFAQFKNLLYLCTEFQNKEIENTKN